MKPAPSAPWSMRPILLTADVVACVSAGLVIGVPSVTALLLGAMVSLIVLGSADLHRGRLEFSLLEELPVYLSAAALSAAALVCMFALRMRRLPSLLDIGFYIALTAVLLAVLRLLVYVVIGILRRRKRIGRPVVIVGAGRVGQKIARALLDHPGYGLQPLGFIDTDARFAVERLPLPVLAPHKSVLRVLSDLGVRDVIFAFTTPPDAEMIATVRACVHLDHRVFMVPRFFELAGQDRRNRTEIVRGIPLLTLRRWSLRPGRAWVKRSSDMLLAGLALLVLSPVLALCALAVRLEGGPGVIFRQERIGRDGRPFTLLKFRSMQPRNEIEADRTWSIDGNSRIGAVGRFLRRSSLDELPQLINVLRGDMSLVGPRPERPHFVRHFRGRVRRYADRHRVETGLTGLAQINGLRGDTSIQERIDYDNYYIENWSMWGDTKIMLRTLRAVVISDKAKTTLITPRYDRTKLGVSVPAVPRKFLRLSRLPDRQKNEVRHVGDRERLRRLRR